MDKIKFTVPQDEISKLCKKYHISRLSFFGSILSDSFDANSDIDVLVEFEDGHTPGLAFFAIQDELSKLLGRKVDLNTPQFLSPYFRDEVQRVAEVQYERL